MERSFIMLRTRASSSCRRRASYERRDPEMEGERALQNRSRFFCTVFCPIFREGYAVRWKITELMQHHREDQLALSPK